MARKTKIRKLYLTAFEKLKEPAKKKFDMDFYDISARLDELIKDNPYRDKFLAVHAVASAWWALTNELDGEPDEVDADDCSETCVAADQFMAFYFLGRCHVSEETGRRGE